MKIVLVLASIATNAERTDGTISPTLMHRAGTGGGGQLPILIMREEDNELPESDRNAFTGSASGELQRPGRVQRYAGDG